MARVGAIKERTGAIDHATRQQAMMKFYRFVSSTLLLTELEPGDFRSAVSLIEGPGALRAGDALHLTIAQRLAADLATLDRRLGDAAPMHGINLMPLV